MRIAWLTPFHHQSSIAHYSETIIDILNVHNEITIFANGHEEDWLTTRCSIENLQTVNVNEENYDLIVANFGDSFANHDLIFKEIMKLKCVVRRKVPPVLSVIHDWNIVNFIRSLCFEEASNNLLRFKGLLEFYYHKTPSNAEAFFVDTPFIELILGLSDAVLVHSAFALQKLKEYGLGDLPVLQSYLPYYQNYFTKQKIAYGKKEPMDLFELLILGNLNTNKCIDAAIKALASPDLIHRKVKLMLAGRVQVAYQAQLENLVKNLGLTDKVEILGWVDNIQKIELLKQVDICINLRSPCLEGASGSVVEELFFGRPTIVMNDGCYRELPDDVVIKLNKVEELAGCLKALMDNVALRERLHHASMSFIHGQRSPELFCQMFMSFVKKLLSQRTDAYLFDILNVTLLEQISVMGIPFSILDNLSLRINEFIPIQQRRRDKTDLFSSLAILSKLDTETFGVRIKPQSFYLDQIDRAILHILHLGINNEGFAGIFYSILLNRDPSLEERQKLSRDFLKGKKRVMILLQFVLTQSEVRQRWAGCHFLKQISFYFKVFVGVSRFVRFKLKRK